MRRRPPTLRTDVERLCLRWACKRRTTPPVAAARRLTLEDPTRQNIGQWVADVTLLCQTARGEGPWPAGSARDWNVATRTLERINAVSSKFELLLQWRARM